MILKVFESLKFYCNTEIQCIVFTPVIMSKMATVYASNIGILNTVGSEERHNLIQHITTEVAIPPAAVSKLIDPAAYPSHL